MSSVFVHPRHRQDQATLAEITTNIRLIQRRIKERHKGLKKNSRELRKTPENDGFRRRPKEVVCALQRSMTLKKGIMHSYSSEGHDYNITIPPLALYNLYTRVFFSWPSRHPAPSTTFPDITHIGCLVSSTRATNTDNKIRFLRIVASMLALPVLISVSSKKIG